MDRYCTDDGGLIDWLPWDLVYDADQSLGEHLVGTCRVCKGKRKWCTETRIHRFMSNMLGSHN